MTGPESLNETVTAFDHNGLRYEVDLLLDSGWGHGWTYEIFEVFSEGSVTAGHMQLDHPDYLTEADIIREAKAELDRDPS